MKDFDEMSRAELIQLLIDEGYDADEINGMSDDELHHCAEQEFAD